MTRQAQVWVLRSLVAALMIGSLTLAACRYFFVALRRDSILVQPRETVVQAMPGQAKIVASYEILNKGSHELWLGDVQTSCGCSVASLSSKHVPPGGRSEIVVEGNPPGAGEKRVVVSVATDSSTQPSLTLALTMVGAGSPPYIANYSPSVRFGDVTAAGAEESFFVETREKRDSAPWIRTATTSLPGLQCEGGLDSEFDAGGGVVIRRYRYVASLLELPPQGEFSGEVVMHTLDGASGPTVSVPVHGIVASLIRVSPSTLLASFGKSETPPALVVRISAHTTSRPLTVKLLSGCPSSVHVRELPRSDSQSVSFQVSSDGALSSSVSTALVFSTNHPGAAEVKVPLKLVCLETAQSAVRAASGQACHDLALKEKLPRARRHRAPTAPMR